MKHLVSLVMFLIMHLVSLTFSINADFSVTRDVIITSLGLIHDVIN